MNINSQRGMATPLVLAVLLVLALAGGVYYFSSRSGGVMEEKKDDTVMEKKDDTVMVKKDDTGAMMEKSPTPSPAAATSGDVMSGTPTGTVVAYTRAGYDAAVKAGKVVVLYYYANWCPICKVEYPKFQSAVARIDSGAVAAFQVNYNDSETTQEEKDSAKQFQVGYQHTVVIVKDGAQVYKSQSTSDFEATIKSYLR